MRRTWNPRFSGPAPSEPLLLRKPWRKLPASLPVVQLPQPGSTWQGHCVTDELSRQEAIEPIANALLALAPGGTAVAALNSDNIFGVLNRLGVPTPAAGGTCAAGQMCVPCLNNTCFPNAFDRLWYIALRPGAKEPAVFLELRYGVGWTAVEPAGKLSN